MGVRLEIIDDKGDTVYWGSKFYGYVEPVEELRGLRYLWNLYSLGLQKDFKDIDEFFSIFSFANHLERFCRLTKDQLIEFLKLYDEDLKAFNWGYTISDRIVIPDDSKYFWLQWGG